VRAEQAGEPVSDEILAEYAKADELVLSKLRAKLGLDELEWPSVGAAPCGTRRRRGMPADLVGFFPIPMF